MYYDWLQTKFIILYINTNKLKFVNFIKFENLKIIISKSIEVITLINQKNKITLRENIFNNLYKKILF